MQRRLFNLREANSKYARLFVQRHSQAERDKSDIEVDRFIALMDKKARKRKKKYIRCLNCGGKHRIWDCENSDSGDVVYAIYNKYGPLAARAYLRKHGREDELSYWRTEVREEVSKQKQALKASGSFHIGEEWWPSFTNSTEIIVRADDGSLHRR